jgi:hypothetical protein
MNELSFNGLIDHIGKSDLVGSYHADGYGMSSGIKHEERLKVIEFILGFYPNPETCIKLLSFPGIEWTFENMLRQQRPRSQFVGLEHSYTAYCMARRAIPKVLEARLWDPKRKFAYNQTEQADVSDRTLDFGTGSYTYSRASSRSNSNSRRVRSNRLLLMKSDTFTSMLTTNYGASAEHKKIFHDKFYCRNAAWLDFTSQFCNSVEETLQNLLFAMDSEKESKPVVVTLMNARDGMKGEEARISRICEAQPAFVPERYWTYSGKGGTSMLTVCGHVV